MKTRNLKKKSKKLRNLMLLTSLCAILSCASGGGGGGGTANNTPSNPDKPSNINTAPSKPTNPSKPNPGTDNANPNQKPNQPETGDNNQSGGNSQNNGNAQNSGNSQNNENAQNSGNSQNNGNAQNSGNSQNNGNAQNSGNSQNNGNAQNSGNSQNNGNAQNSGNSQNNGNAQNSGNSQNNGNAQNSGNSQNNGNAQNSGNSQNNGNAQNSGNSQNNGNAQNSGNSQNNGNAQNSGNSQNNGNVQNNGGGQSGSDQNKPTRKPTPRPRPEYPGNDRITEVGTNSRGMSETNGGTLINNGEIIIKGENGVGMYLANGSKGVNNGTIKTEPTAKNAIGVVLDANSEFTNNGNIIINSDGGIGILANGGIVNNTGYFEIKSKNSRGIVNNGGKVEISKGDFIINGNNSIGILNEGNNVISSEDVFIISGNNSAGIYNNDEAKVSGGNFTITGNNSVGIYNKGNGSISGGNFIIGGSGSSGISLKLSTKAISAKNLPSKRSLGIYVNSLGKTNPIEGLANLGLDSADLLIGAEVTEKTNDTEVTVGSNVLDPFNNSIKTSNIPNWTVKSYSLIWEADPEIKDGRIEKVTLKKQSYAKFADENTEGVAKALDEKYIMASEKDKQIFNYMNKLRDAESLRRVYREVRGNQYTNVQQRINQTDNLLDKQILSLQKDNADKAGHHVETFFDRNKHDFETNEVPDTKSTAYGVSYLFNNTDNNWGLYGGVVINRYKFKDIAHSKENITMFKLGGYKKYELNNFDWTFGGDVFISQNSMKRRFMAGNIYENKADYNAYGFSIKNEISKTYELGENSTIKPYGTLKLGYGNFERIKEKDGTFKLDVKGNSYYSVKPSVGVEVAYTKEITDKTKLKASLDLAYEHELGKIDHKKNEIKYVDTNRTYKLSAKDENRGNFRSGVKVGMEIGNFNFSVNGGYDTKDKNARIGVGFGTSF